MNVKVITRHAPSNYGSLLQSIATIAIIERLGHKCKIIDYQRRDEMGLSMILLALKQKPEWNNNPIKKLLYVLLRYPSEFVANRKFMKMRLKYLKMTEKFTSIKQLSSIKSDIFMTGSDQVWGPTQNGNFDEAYFLSFVGSASRKVAFASSFGRSNFNDEVLLDYKKLLSAYDDIAVRESSAVEMIQDMNIPCVGQVLDPTLLLTADEWSKYIDREVKGNYVLVYQLHNDTNLNKYAERFADKVNLPLLRISPSMHQFNRGGRLIYLPGIGDFLSYIKNCAYLITDSFHGTVFAINFNRPFIEILPNNCTGSRIESILKLTGLEDRIIRNFEDLSIADREIDYSYVNEIIEKERTKSISVLGEICKK